MAAESRKGKLLVRGRNVVTAFASKRSIRFIGRSQKVTMAKIEYLKKLSASLWRPTLAHIIAVTFIGYAITAGVIILDDGMKSTSRAFGISPMYLAALLVFSAALLPFGLLLRFLSGIIPVRPLVSIASMGCIFGFFLIPFMHPELTDGRISMERYRSELFLIHGMAGLLGGAVWWLFEFRILSKTTD